MVLELESSTEIIEGQRQKIGLNEGSSRNMLYSTPPLEALRLMRAFARIKKRALREGVITLVETMAWTGDQRELTHDASLSQPSRQAKLFGSSRQTTRFGSPLGFV